jgi:hypothetical protein
MISTVAKTAAGRITSCQFDINTPQENGTRILRFQGYRQQCACRQRRSGAGDRFLSPVNTPPYLLPSQVAQAIAFGRLRTLSHMARPDKELTFKPPGDPRRRVAFLLLHAAIVALSCWLLLGGGVAANARLAGVHWRAASLLRRSVLAAFSLIYLARFVATVFVFLHRAISWTEIVIVASWLFVLHVSFALLGGSNPAPPGPALAAAIALYAPGSFLNTASEYLRDRWKRDPAHPGASGGDIALHHAAEFRIHPYPGARPASPGQIRRGVRRLRGPHEETDSLDLLKTRYDPARGSESSNPPTTS